MKTYQEVVHAITSAEKGIWKNEIASKLGMSKEALNGYLNYHPELRKLYDDFHKADRHKSKVYYKVKQTIVDSIAGSKQIEIANSLEMSKQNLRGHLIYHPELNELYDSQHSKDLIQKKSESEKLGKLCQIVASAEKGTPISRLKQGMFDYFKEFPQLRGLYEKVHGTPLKGRGKGNQYGSKGKFSQGQLYDLIEKMENPRICDIARQLNVAQQTVLCRLKRHPLLRQLYDLNRGK
jgi:hypothetical protein